MGGINFTVGNVEVTSLPKAKTHGFCLLQKYGVDWMAKTLTIFGCQKLALGHFSALWGHQKSCVLGNMAG